MFHLKMGGPPRKDSYWKPSFQGRAVKLPGSTLRVIHGGHSRANMFNLKQDPLLKTSIIHLLKYHLRSDQNPGCLGYAKDCTSQFYKYYNKL